MGRRTRHNISSKIILSNHFEQKIAFFLQKNSPTRKRVCRRIWACMCRRFMCLEGEFFDNRRGDIPQGNFIGHIRLFRLMKFLPRSHKIQTAAKLGKESAVGFGGFHQGPSLKRVATHRPLPGFFCQAFFHLQNCQQTIRGLSGGESPLTGCRNVATATRLFLPSFFSPGKKAGRRRKERSDAMPGGTGCRPAGCGGLEKKTQREILPRAAAMTAIRARISIMTTAISSFEVKTFRNTSSGCPERKSLRALMNTGIPATMKQKAASR